MPNLPSKPELKDSVPRGSPAQLRREKNEREQEQYAKLMTMLLWFCGGFLGFFLFYDFDSEQMPVVKIETEKRERVVRSPASRGSTPTNDQISQPKRHPKVQFFEGNIHSQSFQDAEVDVEEHRSDKYDEYLDY